MIDQVVYFTGATVWLILSAFLFVGGIMLFCHAVSTTIFTARQAHYVGWAGVKPCCGSKLLRFPVVWWWNFTDPPPYLEDRITGHRIYWPGRKRPQEDQYQ